MPELFPSIDMPMSLIEYNVSIQINLTHSIFKNDIIFAPDRDDHSGIPVVKINKYILWYFYTASSWQEKTALIAL